MNPRELDLTFNPFEDDGLTDEPTPQNRQYFGSAFLPNATTPTARRRSSFRSSNGSSNAIRKRHTRSRTEFDIDIPEPEISGHPLKSAALRSAAFQDFDITRPNLSRIVQSTGVQRRSRSQEPPDSANRSSAKEEEKEVIIHEITSEDSLAGVSLKYGIALPELRRANQLWANDSIHLRKFLYIPIDRAKRAREYLAAASQQSAPTSPAAHDETSSSQYPFLVRSPTSSHPSPAGSSSEVNNTRIHKIPASQLSFFPPSSNPNRTQTPAGTPSPIRTEFNTQRTPYLKPPNPTTRTGSSPANSLSSLLNTLPLAASTRDEIVSRLSFDSVSSSYSDRPPTGSRSRTGSDEETGHEMNSVNKRATSNRHEDSEPDSPSMQTPVPRPFNEIPLTSTSLRTKDSSSLLQPTQTRPLLSTSPPSSYVAQQPPNAYVRTQQLEPSPGMQVPSKGARALGRTQSLGRASSKEFAKLSLFPPTQAEPGGKPTRKPRNNGGIGDQGIELGRPS